MSRDILHAVEIHATPHTLFQAVATQQGQTSFWTADATVQPTQGTIAEFGFPGAPARLKMRVERIEQDRLVEWLCQGDFPYWSGTSIRWEISTSQNPTQTTTLLFRHTGWSEDYPANEFAHVNYTWGQIVARLKAYTESGQAQPFFPAAAATGVSS
jgi:uncharacterized protein YndB with AHSA1/START domain